ncbi:MAG: aminotransferase class I/II-fold pyridoxal phosphate-dependent enzyme [Tannerellaceae bacterium]|jgi:aspartate/methionine/tyrosine aminotransferase|nr:aminotransferase class I/II-fold pyridoxal phosphate-dependent enzyme [Tannerellaceae bacterium]
MQKDSKACNIAPAKRLDSVGEYYFSRKQKEIATINASGRQVINLGIGSPDLPPSKETIASLREHSLSPDEHGYQPYTGIPELRNAFSAWYKTWYNVETNPACEIQPLIGSKEGILHISMAFLNPGDGVLVPNPGYPTYSSVSRLLGAHILEYDLEEENGWRPNLAAIEKADLSGVKLMWVNYPNMPTGAVANESVFESLVDFGHRHGIVIVNDNPYSFILNDRPLSILSAPGAKDVCIEMNSLSKSHNMPGWRMAMLASNARFVEWILKVKSNVDSGQFKPMQYAAVAALGAGKEWYDRMNEVYRSRRDKAAAIMQAIGCSHDGKQAGLFLWGKIPAEAGSAEALSDKLLYEAGVFITPGHIFGSNGDRYMRISLCRPNDTLSEALQRIQKLNQ